MRSLTSLLVLVSAIGCVEMKQNHVDNHKELKMTVILYDNQNPNSEWTKKTIVEDSIITTESTIIDLYFCNKVADLPFYLPTNGIFRDSLKDNECNLEIYPYNVKCYEYDSKGRVAKMTVDGSGTMGNWVYRYDSLDRITEIERFSTEYTAHYMGNLHLLTELLVDDGIIQKKIEFEYKE
ncbi:MAG: RHS repeat protein [Leptolyngbya sp. SIO3F4]|nr:RHS repeat protein [Leptolyngbya sp. SIO3F4]